MSTHEKYFGSKILEQLKGSILADRYKILNVIGQGGMGVIFRAEHIKIGRKLAIKVLHPAHITDEEAVVRFQREAVAAGGLGHPNIIEIIDSGKTDSGLPYIVMEYLEGRDLSQILEKEAILPYDIIVPILIPVCEALEVAHSAGIVHRDIKPENILISRFGKGKLIVKVLDFGIAKIMESRDKKSGAITRTGFVAGTPHYMSPEQVMGEKIDHRTDIYSLGVIMYQAVVGRVPFQGGTVTAITTRIVTEEPQEPISVRREIPSEINQLVLKAMAKKPEKRFQSTKELAAGITNVMDRLDSKQDISIVHPSLVKGGTFNAVVRQVSRKLLDTKKNRLLLIGAGAVSVFFLIILSIILALALSTDVSSTIGDARMLRFAKSGRIVAPAAERAHQSEKANRPKSEKVTIHINALPPQAVIQIDGKKKDENPFTGVFDKSKEMHTIIITAKGFNTLERFVAFKESLVLDYELSKQLKEPVGIKQDGEAPPKKSSKPDKKPSVIKVVPY